MPLVCAVAVTTAIALLMTMTGVGRSHSSAPRVAASRLGERLVAAHDVNSAPAAVVRDPEEAQSFPEPSSAPPHARAAAPERAASGVSPGAPSDAEVRRELRQLEAWQRGQRHRTLGAGQGGSVGGDGTIEAAPDAPTAIARVIAGGNAIATFPYRFGGGHASFVDDAYDCSGSVSYALAAGGLLSRPLTSGGLEHWGAAGRGRWLTVYASAGHTYMYVNGVRFDTSGRSGVFGSRWQHAARSNAGFVARHWPGL
jgi:cell wall-associated NlpC family hydrolase